MDHTRGNMKNGEITMVNELTLSASVIQFSLTLREPKDFLVKVSS